MQSRHCIPVLAHVESELTAKLQSLSGSNQHVQAQATTCAPPRPCEQPGEAHVIFGAARQCCTATAMSPLGLLKVVAATIRTSVASLIDAVPPYYVFEGPLTDKARDERGKCWIRCGGNPVEVDQHTYEILEVGERLRLRYTRGNRAVSIDRLVPPGDIDDWEH